MKLTEFKKLIREEVRKVLKEGKVNVGDNVNYTAFRNDFAIGTAGKLVAIYPNAQAALEKYKGNAKMVQAIKAALQAKPQGPKQPSAQDKMYIFEPTTSGKEKIYAATETEIGKSLRKADSVSDSVGFPFDGGKLEKLFVAQLTSLGMKADTDYELTYDDPGKSDASGITLTNPSIRKDPKIKQLIAKAEASYN